jgi:YD repeat-containing protein
VSTGWARGRTSTDTVSIDQERFVTSNEYDSLGHLTKITYPTSFSVYNIYDQKGFLVAVNDGTNQKPYWIAKNIDPLGRVTEESVGNGVTTVRQFDRSDERLRRIAAQGHDGTQILNLALEYDLIGNLKSRLETIGRKKETFEYDEINRLVAMVSTSSGLTKYKYDTAGRLIFKSGVGVYHYADSDLAPPENDDQPSANAQRYARPLHSVLRTAPENDDQPSANAQRYARPCTPFLEQHKAMAISTTNMI